MKKVFKTMAFTLLGLVLSINLMAATSKVVYTETFEDNAFTAGTTYNNKDEVKHGPEGKQWGVICGTPVTGSHTGSKSFAMRYYKSVSSTPYLTQYFDIQGVDSLKFWAKTESTNNKLSIEYSTNGGTSWNALASGVAITTSYAEYKYEFETQLSSVRIRFSMGTSTEKKSMVIDDIAFVQKLSADAPSLFVSPETIDFGEVEKNATVEGKEVTVTIANITEGVIAYFEKSENSPFEIDNEELTESGTITITPKDATLAEVGEYSDILTITDAEELEKTVAVSIKVKEPAAPTGTFEKFSGDLEEGDYVICSSTDAMNNTTISGPRIGYQTITVSNNNIENPDEAVIWHIAPAATDGYWTIYNEAEEKYAAFTSSDGKGTLLDEVTDYALWQYSTVSSNKEFSNKGKASKYLRKNGTYGFASYGTTTGSALTLYKKASTEPSIKLNKTATTISVGAYEILEATVKNSSATVDWSSSKSDVAEVNQDGKVTAKAEGTATITAKINEGGKYYSATCEVTVTPKATVTSVTIAPAEDPTLYIYGTTKQTIALTATVTGENSPAQTVTWTSSNTDVATVSNAGVVTAVAAGEATITATSTVDDTKSATRGVKVVKVENTQETAYTAEEAIALYDALTNKIKDIEVYVKGTVSSIPTPWDDGYKNITYNISKNGLTSEKQFQLYRCVTNGAEVGDKVIAKGKITYYNPTYEFAAGNTIVSIRKAAKLAWSAGAYTAELGLGEYNYPTLTKTPAALTGVTYSSSNTDAATIDANGAITLKAEGKTTITASFAGDATYDAAEDATYVLTVAAEVQRFTITYNSNGGSEINPVENQTNLPNEFPTPKKDWKVFGGWYLDNETFLTPAEANAPLTDDITLYAKWNDPLSVAEMIALIPNANDQENNIYGWGYITQVDEVNGYATYWITDGENDFEVFKGMNIDGEGFENEDDLPIGNKVMIWGNIKNFKGTPEFDANNQLIHIDVVTTPVEGVSLDKTEATIFVGQTTTLVATIAPAFATNQNVSWSSNKESVATVADGVVTGVAKGEATITVTTEDGNFTATCAVTVEELPIWAYTYTSNVKISADASQKVTWEEISYDCVKTNKGTSATVTIPANTTELHFHIAAWNGEGQTVTIKKGETTLTTIGVTADAGVANNSPYTLQNDPATTDYFSVALSDIAEETTITIAGASGKRFVLFGVNAIQPAAITIDPTSKNFDEVKQGFDADQVFTLIPNAFATGTITAEIDGDNVFTASAVTDNKVTVTFAPTEITDYSATLIIKHDGTQMCTATLSGKGISAATPTIGVDKKEIYFGKFKQEDPVTAQTVEVTLEYVDQANVALSGDDADKFAIDVESLNADGSIEVSVPSTDLEPKEEYKAILTISDAAGEATAQTVNLSFTIVSKWAHTYTSNVKVGSDKVIISEEEYEAHKAGGSKTQGLTTITVPEGAHTLHFHAAGWNSESVTLKVSNGTTELTSKNLFADAGFKGNGPSYTLEGENYDSDQYFYVEFDALEAETDFTFEATSGYRFVLYGVNQEGGILPVLDHITIDGEATKLNYNTTDAFNPVGLTVNAVYTLKGVEQTPVPVTEDVNWTFDPATFNEVGEGLSVTATASFTDGEVTKTADKVINGISVEEATPSISASKVNIEFGEVTQCATVEPIQSKITLKYIDEVSVTLSDATAFEIDKTSMTETGYLTISAVTSAEVGEYTATVTIKDLNSETSKVLNLSIKIKEAPKPVSYTLVTDVNQLAAGDIVVMAATYSNKTYVNGALSGDLLTCVEATLTDDVLSAIGACEFTLAGGEGAWTLTSVDGQLGATAVKKLTYDDTKNNFVDTWTISISNNVATIAPDAEGYGRFMYNHNNGGNRFLTYTSNTSATMLLPQLYKKEQTFEVVRTGLTSGKYGTICLNKEVTNFTGAVFYEIAGYEGEQNNPTDIVLESVETLEAGVPYIFRATAAQIAVTYTGEAESEAGSANGLIGSFIEKAVTPTAYTFGISNNELVKVVSGEIDDVVYVDANRAYIDMEQMSQYNPNQAPKLGAHRVAMNNSSYSGTTNINNLNDAVKPIKVMKDGQLYIIRDAKMFNAQGIEVQ